MKNLIIRPVEVKDAEQYLNTRNIVWRDAYKHIFPNEVFVNMENKTLDMIKTFSQFVYNGGDQFTYVAEDEGKIIGFASSKIKSNYSHFSELGYAELGAIYIHPDYQGLGLGTKFKNMFEKWAKENGASKYVIGVLRDNHKARKVYEKWGGKLDEYTQPFVKMGVEYSEVFYTFDLLKKEQ